MPDRATLRRWAAAIVGLLLVAGLLPMAAYVRSYQPLVADGTTRWAGVLDGSRGFVLGGGTDAEHAGTAVEYVVAAGPAARVGMVVTVRNRGRLPVTIDEPGDVLPSASAPAQLFWSPSGDLTSTAFRQVTSLRLPPHSARVVALAFTLPDCPRAPASSSVIVSAMDLNLRWIGGTRKVSVPLEGLRLRIAGPPACTR